VAFARHEVELFQSLAQSLERRLTIGFEAASLGGGHDDAARLVVESNRVLGLVAMLTAGAAASEDLDDAVT
jgi:hypothetical protein